VRSMALSLRERTGTGVSALHWLLVNAIEHRASRLESIKFEPAGRMRAASWMPLCRRRQLRQRRTLRSVVPLDDRPNVRTGEVRQLERMGSATNQPFEQPRRGVSGFPRLASPRLTNRASRLGLRCITALCIRAVRPIVSHTLVCPVLSPRSLPRLARSFSSSLRRTRSSEGRRIQRTDSRCNDERRTTTRTKSAARWN
jgi:hypothetical protein